MATSPYIGRSLETNIENGEITSAKLAVDAVTTDKIRVEAVTSAKIAANAVGSAALGPNSVNGGHIIDNQVGPAEIADAAINSIRLQNSAVTNAKINNGAVSEDKLAVAVQNKLNGSSGVTTGINPTTSTVVNNSTTLVQVANLVCPIPEAGIYAIDIMLNTGHDTVVPTAGLRLNARFTNTYWPSSGRTKGFWTLHYTTDVGHTLSKTAIQGQTNLPTTINMGSNSHANFSISAGNDYYYQFVEGRFVLDAFEAGDVEIWFAQNTAVAYNTSINRNSWIKATKIA